MLRTVTNREELLRTLTERTIDWQDMNLVIPEEREKVWWELQTQKFQVASTMQGQASALLLEVEDQHVGTSISEVRDLLNRIEVALQDLDQINARQAILIELDRQQNREGGMHLK